MATITPTQHLHPMRRVFVFSLWVRLFHWLNVLAIITLAVTGYLIGKPPAFMIADEASFSFLFGWIRFFHFAAAFVFFFNFLFRIYLMFMGNRFERWYNFVPYRKKDWVELWDVIKTDILMIQRKPMVSMGHNMLAGFTYFILFRALHCPDSHGFCALRTHGQFFYCRRIPLGNHGNGW